jgi:hypothetical protein
MHFHPVKGVQRKGLGGNFCGSLSGTDFNPGPFFPVDARPHTFLFHCLLEMRELSPNRRFCQVRGELRCRFEEKFAGVFSGGEKIQWVKPVWLRLRVGFSGSRRTA